MIWRVMPAISEGSPSPRLVAAAEPVPALRGVGGSVLCRIGDEAGALFGQHVHARANGEVIRRLDAAVQHDDQGKRLPTIVAGDVELIGAATGLVAVKSIHELSPVRHQVRRVRRRPLQQAGYSRLRADPVSDTEASLSFCSNRLVLLCL